MPTLEQALAPRVRNISESVTLAITARAKALKADGEDVIGFGAGEPDFPTPEHIVTAAQEAAAEPAMHRYSPTGGLPALKEALVEKTRRDSGYEITPEQILVTNGGKHSLAQAFLSLVGEGDEVLLPAPYWVSYPEQIRLAGGTPVVVPTTAADGYRTTVEALEEARTERTTMLVLTSPSNPTGAVYPPAAIEAIGAWAAEHDLWVLTDEIYEHLVYGDARHVSLPVVAPEAAGRCVVSNGVAKTYAMTGWRVGWTIAPEPVTKAMQRLQSHTTSNVCNVAQRAALAAVAGPLDDVAVMKETYDRRRRVAVERLRAIDGVECPEPEGAFYAFPSVEGVLGREIAGTTVTTSLELCEALLEHAGVALVPGEGFGMPGCVRLSYALADDDLERGLERIATALA